MANIKSGEVKMLEELIKSAASGDNVEINAKPISEVFKLGHNGQRIDTVILSMEYTGTVAGNPFKFIKNYSFTDDEARYALECLLIANNRLQMDYERLNKGGISIKEEFFTFQNSFIGLPGDASVRTPALRLQNFIHLSRVGVPVSVNIELKHPDVFSNQEGTERKRFGCIAAFVFTTVEGKTTIEKLYNIGSYDDSKENQAEIKATANKRLERDCERLRLGGIKVNQLSF